VCELPYDQSSYMMLLPRDALSSVILFQDLLTEEWTYRECLVH
jgi:hypothetical protein